MKDWHDFKQQNGGIEGARAAFEVACENLFRNIYSEKNVQQVEVKRGDGGIDIFVGKIGVEPITVIQCKFFLYEFGDAQKNQIRSSFKKVIESEKFEIKKWILCSPFILDLDSNIWWSNWVKKQSDLYPALSNKIQYRNGNELIALFERYNLYSSIFKEHDSLAIHKTLDILSSITHSSDSPDGISELIDLQAVLFYRYIPEYEKYYLNRELDDLFKTSLKHANCWIYGSSGVGKTALIHRNLLITSSKFYYFDFGAVTITSADVFLTELSWLISDIAGVSLDKSNNKIRAICKMISQVNVDVSVIVIDEISINHELFHSIAETILQITAYQKNMQVDSKKLRFVISTIDSPQKYIGPLRSKASSLFRFIKLNEWKEDLGKLALILLLNLKLSFTKLEIETITKSSEGNPRLLKNIFMNCYLKNAQYAKFNVGLCIEKAKSEFV
ncbi:ATP-binding protein [Neolewinella antarctica]|uniref:Cdc6-like AAA superfamily ATPase n=1 Tax=Neolewinella antarctica TaxID=442734 RepID=A0ABX0XE94_9BACT|nr:ATP-binding protein [Neolewinella antarctica]NJC27638.1 Cdc6-like AAA superfamily ATPase [Neolewinella antarctica]